MCLNIIRLWVNQNLITALMVIIILNSQKQNFPMARFMQVDLDLAIFLGQFRPRGKDAMRLSPYEAPTHETRPDHNTGATCPTCCVQLKKVQSC